MGSIGVQEMIFIFVLALLIFGPKKLPELGRSLGKGLSEFRRASSELKSSFEREMHNIEQETRLDETPPAATPAATPAAPPATTPGTTAATTTDSTGESQATEEYGGYQYEGYPSDHKS